MQYNSSKTEQYFTKTCKIKLELRTGLRAVATKCQPVIGRKPRMKEKFPFL